MFFKPKWQNVERKTFEQTQSFNHGKRQDLAKYYLEYTKSNDMGDKEAIAIVIRSQFADFDGDGTPEIAFGLGKWEARGYARTKVMQYHRATNQFLEIDGGVIDRPIVSILDVNGDQLPDILPSFPAQDSQSATIFALWGK